MPRGLARSSSPGAVVAPASSGEYHPTMPAPSRRPTSAVAGLVRRLPDLDGQINAVVVRGETTYNGCAATIAALDRARGRESGEVR